MLSAFGVDPDTIVARFNEGLQLMRALWVHDRIDFEGRFWQLDAAAGGAVQGPPAAVVQGTRDVVEGGAELILLNPPSTTPSRWSPLAAEVIPQLV